MADKAVLRRDDISEFITNLYKGDLHAKRVLSLANATLGVLTSASLAVHAIGQGLVQAMGKLRKHGIKQVDRLLSNEAIDVQRFFGYWVAYMVGARVEIVVALDWTSFARDGHETIVLSMLTGHGRATPLMWRTVQASTLKGNQRRYEDELLRALREAMPAGVKVTVVADRGFGNGPLFQYLSEELGFEYVIRLRGDIYVTSAKGERRKASDWVGVNGRSRTFARCDGDRCPCIAGGHGGVRACQGDEGVVVCGGQRGQDRDPHADSLLWQALGDRDELSRHQGHAIRDGDVGDAHQQAQRRDRMLLLSALSIALLTLLGAAGESLGYDRWLKANTVKYRTHSLFRQGLMLYEHIPNWPEHRLRPLIEKFAQMLMEQRVYREIFGVI